MSLVAAFRKRMDHIIVTTGKVPTVLDIPANDWRPLLVELKASANYRNPIADLLPGGSDDWKQAELFGVRIVPGRVNE